MVWYWFYCRKHYIMKQKKQLEISAHSWTDPRGQSWYLFDGTGTLQGHIC